MLMKNMRAIVPQPEIAGSLWLMRFDGAGALLRDRADDAASFKLPDEGFVWLHMDLADVRARPSINQIAELSDNAREALCAAVDHQYLEYSDGFVSGALLDHERTLAGPAARTDYLRFAFDERLIVTARRRPMNCVENARIAVERGARVEQPLALFERMAGAIMSDLGRIIKEIGADFDRVEDLLIDGRSREARSSLGSVRRDAVRISRQIGGLASTLARLEDIDDNPEETRDDALREAAARLVQHTESLVREVSNLQDRARLLQDELNALLNLETNDRLFVLALVTTLLLPATFVTGYFGMNTKNLLFSENENASLYATFLCLAASAVVLFFMRRSGLTQRPGSETERRRAPSETTPSDHSF
ncbi:CorA family divalent cation transporter [Methylocystis sp. IM3]|uniref:CorA family divalent cation transporter n=1 Tax=unclassified Methylocystis TaxID=2625913 RepID=UPI0030F5EA23